MSRRFNRADRYCWVCGDELFDPAVNIVQSVAGDFLALDFENNLVRVQFPA